MFNIHRIAGILPTKHMKKIWDPGKEEKRCRCGSIETQQHFFFCYQKRQVLNEIFNEMNEAPGGLTGYKMTHQEYLESSTHGSFPDSVMEVISEPSIHKTTKRQFIKTLQEFLSNKIYKAIWKTRHLNRSSTELSG